MKVDVLGLARSGTRPGKIHSGYDISLRGGKNSGDDSFAPSLPTSHGRYDAVPEEILPNTSLTGPSSFADFRHRLYDPLSLRVPDSDSESPSAYRRCGLLPGIPEHLASASASAPAMPSSVPSPPSAPAPSPPGQESSAPGLPSPPAPASIVEPALALSSAPILANIWSSGSGSSDSDDKGEGGPAEEWSLASGDESEAVPAVIDVVENWSSASQSSGSASSNSRMVASPSRITLDVPSDIPVLMLEMLPLYSDDFRLIARSYGPQDFGHLADEMFEDSEAE
jgi:hypothetical protein